MNFQNVIKGDFKKWLLYSFDNQPKQDFYNLYKTLSTRSAVGNIKLHPTGDNVFLLSHDAIAEELEISELQRSEMMQYLVKNYFHTQDVDQLARENNQRDEKFKNHNLIHHFASESDLSEEVNVAPHPKETLYYGLKLFVSLFVYGLFALGIAYAILIDTGLITIILYAGIVVTILYLLISFFHGIFIGWIKGNSVRITREQYPEIFGIVEKQAKRLNLKKLPQVYCTFGHFNAFVTSFARTKILMIYSEVIETSLHGDYSVIEYVIAHELGHLKRKHLLKSKLLFPSGIIPFLGLAYSRGCEYTCDRIGYHFSPKGSVEGILIMTTGKEIHSKFNIEMHLQDAVKYSNFWTWLSEKFSTHPHAYKRLAEIKKYNALYH